MPRPPALLPVVLFVVVACSGSASSPPPTGSGGPSPSPTTGGPLIDHPTGAGDVILRFEEGGGFVPVEWLATNAPIFTLYGDGTVVFRNPADAPPEAGDGLLRGIPFRVARLQEAAVQELLDFAITQGGLGIAKDRYENHMVADASTSTFTVQAAGQTKTVAVYALGMEDGNGADTAIRRAFNALADRLRDFDADGDVVSADYQPPAYRGTLIEAGGGGAVRDWPWTTVAPADFKQPADPNVLGFPRRTMTLDEVAELGLADISGGVQGLVFDGPDGKAYSFALRPLLPDEEG